MKTYPSRIKNNDLIEQQLKEKPLVASGMPNTLIVETGAVCTLKCPLCPQSTDSFDLTRELLGFNNLRAIIDYFEEFVDTVLFFNWGEPLLNPSLPEMIQYASGKRICTVVHSNFNCLTEELADRLIESGLSEIIASIDGVSEESYQSYRKRGSFNMAFHNLKMFLGRKKVLGSKSPSVIWKFLVFKQNEHEIELARKIAEQIEVIIDFKFSVATDEFMPTQQNYNNKESIDKFVENYGAPCEQLWRAAVICPDGSILPCCMVSGKKYIVGNFFHQDFKNIWNNERYQLLRKVAKRELKQADESLFCHYCIFGPNKDAKIAVKN